MIWWPFRLENGDRETTMMACLNGRKVESRIVNGQNGQPPIFGNGQQAATTAGADKIEGEIVAVTLKKTPSPTAAQQQLQQQGNQLRSYNSAKQNDSKNKAGRNPSEKVRKKLKIDKLDLKGFDFIISYLHSIYYKSSSRLNLILKASSFVYFSKVFLVSAPALSY